MVWLRKLLCLLDHSLFKIFLVVALLPGCSVFHVLDDTYAERFKSKDLNGPQLERLYTQELIDMKAPTVRPVVAVYPNAFSDLTGQRKSNSSFAMFSTAVTQSPNSLLIHVLKHTADGNFFVVVDRVGLDNLTKERQLIRSTRDQLVNDEGEKKPLMPLLFAGVLFDGAVISYDTNLISGGAGARVFGISKSVFYRQDKVTISLRMISTSTGEILAEVLSSKTLYSYGMSDDLFKFYESGTENVEIEVGNAENEPTTIALQKAIEVALLEIISLGYERSYWKHE